MSSTYIVLLVHDLIEGQEVLKQNKIINIVAPRIVITIFLNTALSFLISSKTSYEVHYLKKMIKYLQFSSEDIFLQEIKLLRRDKHIKSVAWQPE